MDDMYGNKTSLGKTAFSPINMMGENCGGFFKKEREDYERLFPMVMQTQAIYKDMFKYIFEVQKDARLIDAIYRPYMEKIKQKAELFAAHTWFFTNNEVNEYIELVKDLGKKVNYYSNDAYGEWINRRQL